MILMKKIILLYSTYSTLEKAQEIVERLLEKNLIACANIFPVTSFFRWQATCKRVNEYVVIAKTIDDVKEEVRKEISTHHDYEIPCIVMFSCDAESEFANWVESCVQKYTSSI